MLLCSRPGRSAFHQCIHETGMPPEDIVLAQCQQKLPVASAPLEQRHRQCDVHRPRNALRVIGIDEQGIPELARRSGTVGKNEHPWVSRVLSSDELFGHQIHAVSERGYQAHLRRAQEAHKGWNAENRD